MKVSQRRNEQRLVEMVEVIEREPGLLALEIYGLTAESMTMPQARTALLKARERALVRWELVPQENGRVWFRYYPA